MLFFCVFLFESARTAVKSRTNLSTSSGKATKTAGPIGTKFVTHVQIHMGMDIRQTNYPSRHKGALGVLRGSTIQKYWEAVGLAPTLVHVCGLIWEWT